MSQKQEEQVDQHGVQESRQDRKQDDVARSRPGQADEQVRDAHDRGPPRSPDSSTGA